MSTISKPDANPVLAALLTWLLLGTGHLFINGQQRKFIYTLVAIIIGYVLCVLPGMVIAILSIVDAYGNALAMTTTIEDAFGARQMVRGFLLNNELSDFSFAPTDANGVPIANRVQPGKRPRSSMSPTLVFDDDSGDLVLSGGSPGGALIIHYTAKLLYATLNWGFPLQQAIDLPNFGSLNGPTLLEEKRFPPSTSEALQARGHEVKEIGMVSGLQAIRRHRAGVLSGGADLRREGRVAGE